MQLRRLTTAAASALALHAAVLLVLLPLRTEPPAERPDPVLEVVALPPTETASPATPTEPTTVSPPQASQLAAAPAPPPVAPPVAPQVLPEAAPAQLAALAPEAAPAPPPAVAADPSSAPPIAAGPEPAELPAPVSPQRTDAQRQPPHRTAPRSPASRPRPVATEASAPPPDHIAPVLEAPPPAPAAAASHPAASSNPAGNAAFEARIRQAVQDALHYPATARLMGLTGRARVELSYRAGAVTAVSLVETAGSPVLDAAAEQAAREAHYPPAPADVGDQLLRFVIWVDFKASER